MQQRDGGPLLEVASLLKLATTKVLLPHYILHPSLQLLIQQKYGNTGYYTFPYIRVGNDCPWFEHYGPLRLLLCSIREHLREPDRRSISEFLDVIHGDFTGKPDPEKYGRTKYLNLWQQFEARGLDEIAVRLEDFIDSCGVWKLD